MGGERRLLVLTPPQCSFFELREEKNQDIDRNTSETRNIRPSQVGFVVAVAEWYKYRIMACLITSSSPVPLKTRRVGKRSTLNLSRAETSSRWCGVVVRRRGASSGVVHVT
ncbi:uncharacterized protein TNCV_1840381 [Trichonephila clavipes]|nr:uncharacterized protein TNCV_1840381 [Trichonephila clavipes]